MRMPKVVSAVPRVNDTEACQGTPSSPVFARSLLVAVVLLVVVDLELELELGLEVVVLMVLWVAWPLLLRLTHLARKVMSSVTGVEKLYDWVRASSVNQPTKL